MFTKLPRVATAFYAPVVHIPWTYQLYIFSRLPTVGCHLLPCYRWLGP